MENRKYKAAFDVDGTLIDEKDAPRAEVIGLMRALYALGWEIYVMSGGGVLYAKKRAEELGLDKEMKINIALKGDPRTQYDIMVDDSISLIEADSQGMLRYINAKLFIKV